MRVSCRNAWFGSFSVTTTPQVWSAFESGGPASEVYTQVRPCGGFWLPGDSDGDIGKSADAGPLRSAPVLTLGLCKSSSGTLGIWNRQHEAFSYHETATT